MTHTRAIAVQPIDERDLHEEIIRTQRILNVLLSAPETSVIQHGRQLYERRLHVLKLSLKRLQRYPSD